MSGQVQSTTTSLNDEMKINSQVVSDLSRTRMEVVALLVNLNNIKRNSGKVTIHDIPDNQDEYFTELIKMGMVQVPVSTDGNIIITKQAEKAISKGIFTIYPLTPRGTSKDYNKTLDSMSESAANALVISMINTGRIWFNKIRPNLVGKLLEAMFTNDSIKSLSINDKMKLFNESMLLYYNTIFTRNPSKALSDAEITIESLFTKTSSQLKTLVKSRGGSVKLPNKVFRNNYEDVTKLDVLEDQLFFECLEASTGEIKSYPITDIMSYSLLANIYKAIL